MLSTIVMLPFSALLSPPSWLPKIPWNPSTPPPTDAAATLLDALLEGETDSALLKPLVDDLCAAEVPFNAALLGDGELWRAVSIVTGETPRWQRNAELLPFLKNRAGQAYSLAGDGGTVINYGEVLGRTLYFKAEGTFKPAAVASPRTRARCPVDFNVAISSGGFVVGGKEFTSSAISGPGYLRCLYIDENLRIFESPKDSPDRWEEAGLVVVQVRDRLFADAVEGDL